MKESMTQIDQVPTTMNELIRLVQTMPDLLPTHIDPIVADVRRAMELIPALATARPNGRVIAPLLKRLHPVNTDLSQKRISNIRASVRRLLKIGYRLHPGAQHRTGLTGQWKSAFAILGPRSKIQMEVSRFAHWCQARAILPAEVTDEHVDEFALYLNDVATVEKPIHRARVTVNHWNLAARTLDGWPKTILALPSSKNGSVAPTFDQLNPQCRQDIKNYIELMRNGTDKTERDQFDLDTEHHTSEIPKYTESTIRQRISMIRRALRLLAVATQKSIVEIDLADITQKLNAAKILAQYKRDLGENEKSPSLKIMALTLLALGKNHAGLNITEVASLKYLVKCADKPSREHAKNNPGMTDKNRERLQRIGANELKALFRAPSMLLNSALDRIREDRAGVSDLIDAQIGVGIAILLHAPLRGDNLASLELHKQITMPNLPGGCASLHIDASETKTGRSLDFTLPQDVTALIWKFQTQVMPYFDRSSKTNYIFPGLGNATKAVSHVGGQIKARVQQLTGVPMNQHLFRHFLACLYLRANPGSYGVVQALLMHATMETTRKYYCGLEAEAAINHFHQLMATIKSDAGLSSDDMSHFKTPMIKSRRR